MTLRCFTSTFPHGFLFPFKRGLLWSTCSCLLILRGLAWMKSANFVPHIGEVSLSLLRWKGMPANINSSPLKRMHQKGKERGFEASKFDFIFVCWLVSGWCEWLTSDVDRTSWTICDTKIYGFILQAVELPFSRGSCEDDLRFLWRRSLEHTAFGTFLPGLSFWVFFGAKTV